LRSGAAFLHRALPSEHHVRGGEGCPIVPGHTVAQVENPLRVGDALPGDRELGDNLHFGSVADQGVEHVAQDGLYFPMPEVTGIQGEGISTFSRPGSAPENPRLKARRTRIFGELSRRLLSPQRRGFRTAFLIPAVPGFRKGTQGHSAKLWGD